MLEKWLKVLGIVSILVMEVCAYIAIYGEARPEIILIIVSLSVALYVSGWLVGWNDASLKVKKDTETKK